MLGIGGSSATTHWSTSFLLARKQKAFWELWNFSTSPGQILFSLAITQLLSYYGNLATLVEEWYAVQWELDWFIYLISKTYGDTYFKNSNNKKLVIQNVDVLLNERMRLTQKCSRKQEMIIQGVRLWQGAFYHILTDAFLKWEKCQMPEVWQLVRVGVQPLNKTLPLQKETVSRNCFHNSSGCFQRER